jgi:tetratricopeptide (TPR) repeat protein
MTGPGFVDRYGLQLSTASAAAATHYREGIDRLLALGPGADRAFDEALLADEGFALAHAARGRVHMLQARRADAAACLARARSLAGGVTPRERRHIEAIGSAVDGDVAGAIGLIREQLAEYPRDALLLQLAYLAIQMAGGPRPREEIYQLLAPLASAYGDDWYYLAARAMLLQDLHRIGEARRDAERALALQPRAAIAAHPVAHVFYETGDHTAGAAFLADWLVGYDRGVMMFSHLSWHRALAELALGHYDQVMTLYDHDIQPLVAMGGQPVADASSLLWRCQLYGAATAPLPWADLHDLLVALPWQPGFAFYDAHLALVHAACGDEPSLVRLIDGLRALDGKGHPIAGPLVVPMVQGLVAFSQGRYAEAVGWLAPVAEQVGRIGGSNAQREVFEDTLLEAYLRVSEFEAAAVLLRRRLDRRHSARDYYWLARAQSGSGDAQRAAASLNEAATHWKEADGAAPEQAAFRRMREALPG